MALQLQFLQMSATLPSAAIPATRLAGEPAYHRTFLHEPNSDYCIYSVRFGGGVRHGRRGNACHYDSSQVNQEEEPMTYRAPVGDISFTLNHIAGLSQLLDRGLFADLDTDTVSAILEEAARFANEELAPTNRAADEQGARLVNGEVVMPAGVTEAYRKWIAAGWGSVAIPQEHGGQGLPLALSMAVTEMWNSANMAFGLNPLLTQAGVHAIIAHGTEDLQRKYLPKLVTGEWTGSMQLTEPHAGCRFALPQDAGRSGWRWHLQDHGHKNLHHLRRALDDG